MVLEINNIGKIEKAGIEMRGITAIAVSKCGPISMAFRVGKVKGIDI